MGGFECSTHRTKTGKRLDLIEATRHDRFAEADYGRMLELGLATARDGVRWHLIEQEPFRYDFSSLGSQVKAAKATGIQIIWDYFHYGYPEHLDIFSEHFVDRFASFAASVTAYLKSELGEDLFVCPVNEISFFSWIAAEKGVFFPGCTRRGKDLKEQLVTTTFEAVNVIRAICPTVRFVVTDPAIHVVPKDDTPQAKRAAESYRRAQFEAFDVLAGKSKIKFSQNGDGLDIVGLNYYFHNQWRHPSRRKIPRGHEQYRPLHKILGEFYRRYGRPILIAETGIEDDERADWFKYVCEQVSMARSEGVPVHGICLYPIVNHPGWADNRHCHNGLWDYADRSGRREIYQPLADEIALQRSLCS